ncbi:MAG TPA: hypothetical protein VGI75_08900 [Pirellulales bacterium]
MRLTLRTMLAYLDEILEPADREDIARKIADSPFATALLERIRDTMRNPKLPAPKLMDQGMGLDPNTVAEYLDNTLAGERVPEFETVCLPPQEAMNESLESDVFLAEVAGCHQILTMVLGHPAQVDPEMKRRMYAIIDQTQIEQAVTDPEAAELRLAPIEDGLSRGSLADFEFKPRRRKPEVPDYLRQPTGGVKWKPIVAGVILALVLLVAVTMALGPPDYRHPLWGWLFHAPAEQTQVAEKPQPVLVNSSAHPAESPVTPPTIAPPPVMIQPPIVVQNNPLPNPIQSAPQAISQPNTQSAAANSNPSPAPPSTSLAGTANPTSGAVPSNSAAPAVAPIVQPADARTPSNSPAILAPESPVANQADAARASTTNTPSPVVDNARPPANNDAPAPGDLATDKPSASGSPPSSATESKPIGTFPPATKETLLFRIDNLTHQWFKLPTAAGAPLFGGNQLLVLSDCRPTLGLISSISMQIPPESMLQLDGPDAAGVLGLKLFFGRLVATTTGKNGTQLRLDFGPIKGAVTFVDSDATLAVEIHCMLPPGANPEVTDPVTMVDLYSVNGQIQWTSAEGAVATLRASQRLTLPATAASGNALEAQQTNLPKWTSPESLSSLDERCIEQLTTSLESGKPLETALREMADRPQVEQHAFAAECLSFLGEFDPLITALNDPDRKLRWTADIAALRAALTRGPAMAATVRESFEKLRGQEAGRQLYRMLLGYSKDQLQNGEAEHLVDALDNDSLDFRELAFVNLTEITGKTHSYHPDDATPAARSLHIKQWREDLRSGAIVPHDATSQK